MNLLKSNPHLTSLLEAPAFSAAGFTDSVVDETVVETHAFAMIPGDSDSAVLVEKTIEYNAARDKLSVSIAEIVNAPTIVDATTDHTTDTQIPLDQLCTIEITGHSFGAHLEDFVVYAVPTSIEEINGRPLYEPKYQCTIIDSDDIDDPAGGGAEMTVTVYLSTKERYRSAKAGPVTLVIINKKRAMSSTFTGLVAV